MNPLWRVWYASREQDNVELPGDDYIPSLVYALIGLLLGAVLLAIAWALVQLT